MVTILSLIFPNFTLTTLVGILLIIVGIALFLIPLVLRIILKVKFQDIPILGSLIPKPLLKIATFFGQVSFWTGIFLTFIVSFFEDLFSNIILTISFVGIITLGLLIYFLFIRGEKIDN